MVSTSPFELVSEQIVVKRKKKKLTTLERLELKVATQEITRIHDVGDVEYQPWISLTHWGWCEYTKRVGGEKRANINRHKLNSANGDNKGDGFLSAMSCKKLKKSINFLIYVSRFKKLSATERQLPYRFTLNFITLTLPSAQQHSDTFIKKNCLDPFIAYMKYHHGLWAYVWKGETQDNDNIHFHIITNVFIDHNVIRQVWNRIVEKHGYIDAYESNQKAKFADGYKFNPSLQWINKKTGVKEQLPEREQKRRYHIGSRSGWRNPNSTDVHTIKQVSNLGGYLATYMGKKDKIKKSAPKHLQEEFLIAEKDATKMQELKDNHPEIFKRPITGQLWNSSINLKTASVTMRVTEEVRVSLLQMQSDIAKVVFTDTFVSVTRFVSGVIEQATAEIAEKWSNFLSVTFPELCYESG